MTSSSFPPKNTSSAFPPVASEYPAPATSMAASSSTATGTAVSGPTSRGNSMLPGPPPPTPSNHHQLPSGNDAGGTDTALSAFLHRMLLSSPAPPLRSPPTARWQPAPSLPPLFSLDAPDPRALRDAAETGYFHLAGHGVPSELPSSALADLTQIDASARVESNLRALGFSEEEEEQDGDGEADDPALVFDASEGEVDAALPAAAAEYARQMRGVGMRVVALLSGCADVAGFWEDPFAEGRRNARCLVWASKVSAGETAAPLAAGKAKAYPYLVGLHCQWEALGNGKEATPASWVRNDAGEWTAVGARDGALLVTIGDIAQVWSNGKLRKVRGITRPASADGLRGEPADRLSVTVLITLPLDSVISPLVPCSDATAGEEGRDDETAGDDGDEWKFHSFLLEDYAWRVYHQRLQFKDPLVRYRI